MKTAMFIIAICDLVFLLYGLIVNQIKIDVKDYSKFYEVHAYIVVYGVLIMTVALCVLSIVSKFI